MKRSLWALMTCLAGCAFTAGDLIPVRVYPAFTLGELLAEPIAVDSGVSLSGLLASHWYAEFSFEHAADPAATRAVRSCVDLEMAEAEGFDPSRESGRDALQELAVMCVAGRHLMGALPSRRSFWSAPELSRDLPSLAPAELAFVTSTSERSRRLAMHDSPGWADINAIRSFERLPDGGVRFVHDMGSQDLYRLGRGDMNRDGVEDLLLVSRDSVADGSWFGLRLFILTRRSAGAALEIVDSYLFQ